MNFNIIVIDAPWHFSDQLKMSKVKRGAISQYKSILSDEDILNLDVKSIAADDALLALWVPSSKLQLGLDCMKAYGFDHKQTLIWVKIRKSPWSDLFKLKYFNVIFKTIPDQKSIRNVFLKLLSDLNWQNLLAFGMGRLFRQSHEVVLLGTRGKIYKHVKDKSLRSVIFAPNEGHSKKPELFQDMLDKLMPSKKLKKVELFARRDRFGYTCLGNENPSTLNEDIRDSIKRLANI